MPNNDEIEARIAALVFLKEALTGKVTVTEERLKAAEIIVHNTHSLPKLHKPRNFRGKEDE